jgi:glucose-6-phosphate isomerase
MTALTNTPTWQKLASLAEDVKQQHMRDWFANVLII